MRIRRVQSKQEFERVIDDFITQGYKVESRGEKSAKMKEKDYGGLGAHIIILIFTCWTFGIGNLIYLAYKYYSAEEVMVKLENEG